MFIRNEEKKSMGDKRTRQENTLLNLMFVVFMCTKKYGHQ